MCSTAAWINGPIGCARLNASDIRAMRSTAAWINGTISSHSKDSHADAP